MTRILIQNGRVIDPSQSLDRVTNLLIENGRIAAIDRDVPTGENADGGANLQVIDAAGRIVAPGFIDLGTELREPGFEEDETIKTGTAAALAGGFTTVACLPGTDPPIDSQGTVEFVQHQAERANHCNVVVIACVSKNREGKELAEIGQLVQAGAVAFSDGDAPIANAELMRRAFQYSLMFDKPILSHAEVKELTNQGVMHDGLESLILGLPGMPAAAEEVMVSRDISLAEATGGRLHILQVSTAGSVEILRRAKARGVKVTAGISPHLFTLNDRCLRAFDSNYKTNPPLRSERDVEACMGGLIDGTIDVICSQHAPHAQEKKMQELDLAPFGIVGLETALGLAVTQLIEPGHLDWPATLAHLTCHPAAVLGLQGKGTLRPGADADITIIDPDGQWEVDTARFHSKSRCSPFHGRRMRGLVEMVIVGGKVKYRAASLVS